MIFPPIQTNIMLILVVLFASLQLFRVFIVARSRNFRYEKGVEHTKVRRYGREPYYRYAALLVLCGSYWWRAGVAFIMP